MKYIKYEFQDMNAWLELKSTIWSEDLGYINCHVVEIGHIVITPAIMDDELNIITPAVVSDNYAVDILWDYEEPLTFIEFQVWPSPVGVHTFAGLDWLYEEEYYEKYPDKKPINTIYP
jgi:hypothetical protein